MQKSKILDRRYPYSKVFSLMTPKEKEFYFVLKEVLGNEYTIFSKVRLADLFYLRKEEPRRRYYLDKIISKHVDFVVCDNTKMHPKLVIELDGFHNLRKDRVRRDEFVDQIMHEAGLKIAHIKGPNFNNPEWLKNKLKAIF